MSVLVQERMDDGRICLLTLNRPEVMNAVSTELGLAMDSAMAEVVEDPKVRVIIFTGAGDRAFSTGGDLKERNGMTEEQWYRQHRMFEEVHRKIRTCLKPVICAVNGYALGGGCELALSGDFVYASKTAKFGFPEVTRGIIPGVGGLQTLGRFLPRGKAIEMLLSGQHMTADDAYLNGMINQLTDPESLLDETLAIARKIAANSPLAVRMAKKAFRLGLDMPVEDAIDFSLECYNRTIVHPDRDEGVKAFNERRDPQFRDIY